MLALVKKNWIEYKRTWFSSGLELLLPILLMSILVICRDQLTKTIIPPQGYDNLIPIEMGDEWINATVQLYPFFEDFQQRIPLSNLTA